MAVLFYLQKIDRVQGDEQNKDFQCQFSEPKVEHRHFRPKKFATVSGNSRKNKKGAGDDAEVPQVILLSEVYEDEKIIKKHHGEDPEKDTIA